MKKNVMRILAAVLALTMVFSLAACGNDDKGSGGAGNSSSEASSEESSQEASTSADGMYATVKDFLEDPTVKAMLDETISQMVDDNETMSVSLEGTDDTLIYVFKFSDEAMATTDADALKAALAEGLEEEDFVSTFEGIAASVSEVVETDNAKVKVVYAMSDGTELASKEYSAK